MNIAFIPDTQVKPGVSNKFLANLGKYVAEKQPDVIVHAGDFADMASLSSHDKAGSKVMENKRYNQDIAAAKSAMDVFMAPIARARGYDPKLIMLGGNHENRILRCVNNIPQLEGTISLDDLSYKDYGWEVHDFLKPVTVNGVVFCHYFASGVMGRPITTARALLTKKHQSCVAGHLQGRDIAYGQKADGTNMTTIIAGSCYEHDEEYLNPQTNNHWRGFVMLHDVKNGEFDDMWVSLRYLNTRYGK